MIQHVRFNIRNRWQNVFLKIGGKHRRIFNKMSEIKTINFYCCTTIFDTSNLNTHFYLVFWLLPYQWYFCIKAELRRSWLNFVVVPPPAGKARLLQNHSNCCKLVHPESEQHSQDAVPVLHGLALGCSCKTRATPFTSAANLPRFCWYKESPGSLSILFCTQP